MGHCVCSCVYRDRSIFCRKLTHDTDENWKGLSFFFPFPLSVLPSPLSLRPPVPLFLRWQWQMSWSGCQGSLSAPRENSAGLKCVCKITSRFWQSWAELVGRPIQWISFFSLEMMFIAISTLRASYTRLRMFFWSYTCWGGRGIEWGKRKEASKEKRWHKRRARKHNSREEVMILSLSWEGEGASH